MVQPFAETAPLIEIPPLKIGERVAKVPIIQGGMGVGVSLSGLASAVAREGGIGVIAGAAIGLVASPSGERFAENNMAVLRREIKKARESAPGGLIGVNVMVALTDHAELCRVAVEEGADFIFSGAGLPMALPSYSEGTSTLLVPIVSSGRAAMLICDSWRKKHDRLPDAFVVEGPKAGGHLGFSREQLERMEEFPLSQLLLDTLEAVKPFEDRAGRAIPVIAGGGVFDGADIARCLKGGASGVQIATRFVCTEECDAAPAFKKMFLDAQPEDLMYVSSPVGMPGRAIRNPFLDRVLAGERVHTSACPYHCLKTCDPENRPYCIAIALNQARLGQTDKGLVFAGENVSRLNEIVPVKQLMADLMEETRQALAAGA
jgi:nitronate monooxygenase